MMSASTQWVPIGSFTIALINLREPEISSKYWCARADLKIFFFFFFGGGGGDRIKEKKKERKCKLIDQKLPPPPNHGIAEKKPPSPLTWLKTKVVVSVEIVQS